jgi:hypothetical protein
MPGAPEKPKKPASKIVQVMTNGEGLLVGVLYANGRVFLWTYTIKPDPFEKKSGEGYWAEMSYPNLKQTEK